MGISDDFRQAMAGELARIKRESFVKGYEATDAEAFGLLMSSLFHYDGPDIMQAASYALEDANFHDECALLQDLAKFDGDRASTLRNALENARTLHDEGDAKAGVYAGAEYTRGAAETICDAFGLGMEPGRDIVTAAITYAITVDEAMRLICEGRTLDEAVTVA